MSEDIFKDLPTIDEIFPDLPSVNDLDVPTADELWKILETKTDEEEKQNDE